MAGGKRRTEEPKHHETKQQSINMTEKSAWKFVGLLLIVIGIVIFIINLINWIGIALIVVGYIVLRSGGYKIALIRI